MVPGGARRRSERWRVVRGFEREGSRSRTWYVETVPSRLPVAACEARVDARALVAGHNFDVRTQLERKARQRSESVQNLQLDDVLDFG